MSETDDAMFEAHWRDDVGFFGPASMMWKVMRNPLLGLAGSRALIMQLALPDVAQGVASHSTFMARPLLRAFRTVAALKSIVFGDRSEAKTALFRVRGLHEPVAGILSSETSRHRAGASYTAADPRARLWVLACFATTVQDMHDRLFVPLDAAQCEEFWRDWQLFGRLFGLRDAEMPGSWTALQSHVDGMLQGSAPPPFVLEPHMPTVRRLSKRLFYNWLSPLLASGATTWGLVPPELRHLVVVMPPVLQRERHALCMWLLRLLARASRRRQLLERVYVDALARIGPDHPGLEPWERSVARSVRTTERA